MDRKANDARFGGFSIYRGNLFLDRGQKHRISLSSVTAKVMTRDGLGIVEIISADGSTLRVSAWGDVFEAHDFLARLSKARAAEAQRMADYGGAHHA